MQEEAYDVHGKSHLVRVWRARAGEEEDRVGWGWWGRRRKRSDTQGHVTEQPLLRAAVVAVSQGGHHLVLFRRHVQTLVAVHMQQGEFLMREGQRRTC